MKETSDNSTFKSVPSTSDSRSFRLDISKQFISTNDARERICWSDRLPISICYSTVVVEENGSFLSSLPLKTLLLLTSLFRFLSKGWNIDLISNGLFKEIADSTIAVSRVLNLANEICESSPIFREFIAKYFELDYCFLFRKIKAIERKPCCLLYTSRCV